MEQSIVELIARQRQRVDFLARLAGRFLDEAMSSALTRLSSRLCRLAATLSTPSALLGDGRTRLEGQLERLVREIGQLRIDEPTTVARAAWVLAEMEESFRNQPAGGVMMPVYTAN